MNNAKLVILAAGLASRMKKSVSPAELNQSHLHDARSKTKSMIGLGADNKPFLAYLLDNAIAAGYSDLLLVINSNDTSIRDYFKEYYNGLTIEYAYQMVREGLEKPAGTADALLQGLLAVPEWKGSTFTVCNSDNLYSRDVLEILLNINTGSALIDYDRSALEFEKERVEAFAVIRKSDDGYVTEIVEKPDKEEVERIKDSQGRVGVSMNIYRLRYDVILPFLVSAPMHPVRKEKDLPVAVSNMATHFPKEVMAIPRSEHVPDLTSKSDIAQVHRYLS
ncbi:MAG: nucleotidyltransferase [Ignavibacteria bacterium]|nr:nucleotidyltransferase [Ignavibacteria bacterium]